MDASESILRAAQNDQELSQGENRVISGSSPFNPLPLTDRADRLPLLIEVMPEFAVNEPPPRRGRVWLPLGLFVATCVSTFAAGVFQTNHFVDGWQPALFDGAMYSSAVMLILLCHEMGHYLQALRYGVYATLPYFIPMPLGPIGTFGAVIALEPRSGNRKAVFDIGISGPLAGLIPTLIFLCIGLQWSHVQFGRAEGMDYVLGMPLLVKMIFAAMHGPIPAEYFLVYHPLAFAGWVGLLVTSINLIPIGQLDGGHILYGMLRREAHIASVAVLILAMSATIYFKLHTWWPMLGLITFLGTRHPPTTDDSVPLGAWRYALGIATLAFIVVGFTPKPILPF